MKEEIFVGAILPAVGGVVLLILGGIYLKWIKPFLDAKKEKAREIIEQARFKERNNDISEVLQLLLPKIPMDGVIAIDDLVTELIAIKEAAGETPRKDFPALIRLAIASGVSKKSGPAVLTQHEKGYIGLGSKGKELRMRAK